MHSRFYSIPNKTIGRKKSTERITCTQHDLGGINIGGSIHTTRNAYDKKFTSICSIIRRYKLLKPTCTSDYYFLNFFFFKQTCNRAQLVPEGWHHLDFINSSAHTHEFRILLQSTVDLQDCCFYNYSKDNRCTYAYHFTLQTVLIKFNNVISLSSG